MKSKNLLLLLSTLALVACGGKTSEGTEAQKPSDEPKPTEPAPEPGKVADGIRVAYGQTGGNIIRAEVVAKDGKVADVHFDEVQVGGSTLATANTTNTEIAFEVKANSYVAKYLNFNGDVYAGTLDSETKKVTFAKDGVDFDTMIAGLTSQEDLATVYHTIVNNFVFGSDAAGNDLGVTHQYSKSSADSTYWPTTESAMGWKGNTAKIEAALIGLDLTKEPASVKGDDKNKIWTLNGVPTGATTNSFATYVNLARDAFLGTSLGTVSYGRDMIEGREKNGHSMCFVQFEAHFDAAKKATKVFINETDQFLSLAAKLTDEEKALLGEDEIIDIATTKNDVTTHAYYAKYIKVGGQILTGAAYEEAYNKEVVKYTAEGITDALDYFGSTEELARDYYHNAFLHDIDKVKADGTVVAPGTRGNGTATKSEKDNGYWNVTDGSKDTVNLSRWKWNVNQLQKAFEGLDLSSITVTAVKDEKDKVTGWTFNGVATGASMTETQTFASVFAPLAASHLA